jgi:hypothetical protein
MDKPLNLDNFYKARKNAKNKDVYRASCKVCIKKAKEEKQYTCPTCDIKVQCQNKTSHEKTKRHLEKSNPNPDTKKKGKLQDRITPIIKQVEAILTEARKTRSVAKSIVRESKEALKLLQEICES